MEVVGRLVIVGVVVLTAVGAVLRVVRRIRLSNTLVAAGGLVVFPVIHVPVGEVCVELTDVVSWAGEVSLILTDCVVKSAAVDDVTSGDRVDDSGVTVRGTAERASDSDTVKYVNSATRRFG